MATVRSRCSASFQRLTFLAYGIAIFQTFSKTLLPRWFQCWASSTPMKVLPAYLPSHILSGCFAATKDFAPLRLPLQPYPHYTIECAGQVF